MHHVTAVSIQNGAQVVERATDVDVGDVNVPMLVRFCRLIEPFSLLGRRLGSLVQLAGSFQHPIDAAWAGCHDVCIQHHIRQTTISFFWMLPVVVDDGLPFPSFQPKRSRDLTIMLILLPVPLVPIIILASAYA